jgi:hypothetical protein
VCQQTTSQTVTVYFWVDSTGESYPDTTSISFPLVVNGEETYTPSGTTVAGGNGALDVNWGWPTGITPSTDTNFDGLQIFCSRGDSYQVYPDRSYSAAYQQSAGPDGLCPSVAPVNPSPSAFDDLSPLFLCSGLLPSTATSARIEGLQNGIWYGVGVAAIDKYGNVGAIDPSAVVYGMPVATVDFYTEYRNLGGTAQGGFCSLSGWRGRPGALSLLSCAVLTLLLCRRRRRKIPPGALAMLLAAAGMLAPGSANAQAIFHDEEGSMTEAPPSSTPWGGSERNYAVELRFGLFYPDLDSEPGFVKTLPDGVTPQTPPNQLVFGKSSRPMWEMEFDWEILQTFGTLAVGATIGYWKENGHACLSAQLQLDSNSCVSSADNTSLRLIPFAALLVYRMDEIPKRWSVPLVPYAKLGLNYTIWTIVNGDGNVPDYPGGGRGQGGTPGWQGALGLSLQLDFIDSSAAHEFDSESGVNHTYAFFEMDYIDGSGLYRNNVLRVGDNTWFTGLMFEF